MNCNHQDQYTWEELAEEFYSTHIDDAEFCPQDEYRVDYCDNCGYYTPENY